MAATWVQLNTVSLYAENSYGQTVKIGELRRGYYYERKGNYVEYSVKFAYQRYSGFLDSYFYNDYAISATFTGTDSPQTKTGTITNRNNGTTTWATLGPWYYRKGSAAATTISASAKIGSSKQSFNAVVPAGGYYTVTFDANGGTTPTASKTAVYGYTYGEMPVATRSGWGFDGWYTAAEGGTKITSSTTVSLTANQTLYAQWTADSQTLTFDANGGVCDEDSRTVATGSAYGTLPTPTRTGYAFAGWYTQAEGGTQVTDETTMAAGGATVYAHWTANTYTLTFNANGGSCATASKSVTYDSAYGTLPTPTRTGYAFLGWFTAAEGGAEILETDTVTITNSRTVFAHWEPMSILHVRSEGVNTTVTRILVKEGATITPVLKVFGVVEGVPKQGI